MRGLLSKRASILVLIIASGLTVKSCGDATKSGSSDLKKKYHKLTVAKTFGEVFTFARRISLITPAREPIGVIGRLCVLRDNSFLIADGITTQVLLFDQSGIYLRRIGKKGGGPGEYRAINDIACDRQNIIHVLHAGIVSKFSTDGRFLSSFKLPAGHGYSMALDSEGNIYVYDAGTLFGENVKSIYKYTKDGELVLSFSSPPEILRRVQCVLIGGFIGVDRNGFIYRVHCAEYRIEKYSPTGQLMGAFSRKARHYKPWSPDIKVTYAPQDYAWLSKVSIVTSLVVLDDDIVCMGFGPARGKSGMWLEFYDTEGHFITGDIEMPEGLIPLAGKNGELYFSRQPEPDATGNLPNPELWVYKLNMD